ncbi:alpha-glucosidase [Parasegetibacter sp. NRK P23]|uniref:glycoside hydrolase family 13 protein n=1 Tax=Parasegetibacter sp. NRK P23 TaxID=2942999 RepID=UPI0020446494|nr:alpha-glucosidase [Parasegetibacter sp. NRK P23]MCM5529311.1 alpha-glucosidase [Parasegetibacter sp. NRK P23]
MFTGREAGCTPDSGTNIPISLLLTNDAMNGIFSGKRAWWKEGIVYQVYVRSFKDSNGDGIGDLKGMLAAVDYIAALGVDMVWINPVLASPNNDNGYDIRDFRAIMKEYGTMKDFEALLKALHKKNIRLIMDFVLNHTSDEHQWFKKAKRSRKSPYYQYYHWWPEENGKPPKRYSFFDPKGDAWTYNKATRSWYLHYFSAKMPDLNWEHEPVRNEMLDNVRFWFDKGVDGLRLDAVTYLSKDTSWPVISDKDIREKYREDWSYYLSQGPQLHEYLRELHDKVLQFYDVTTIAEAPGISHEEAPDFVKEERKELQMLYHFEGMQLGYAKSGFKRPDPDGYDLLKFKEIYSRWDKVFSRQGWGTVYLGNHDQPRMVSRWGNEAPGFRNVSAKMLITFLLTMRATPIFYNGDELGMANIRFENINDYRDVETLSMYQYLEHQGEDLEAFLRDQQFGARDNARTPFQWSGEKHAGFTNGEPWIKVNPDHVYVNAKAQVEDPDSVLNFFRKMVQLRKERLVLVYGEYQLEEPFHQQLYVYTRRMKKEGVLVVLNFSPQVVPFQLPHWFTLKEVLLNNVNVFQMNETTLTLLPYQALILDCKSQ